MKKKVDAEVVPKKEMEKKITLPAMKLKTVRITLLGTSPLLVHKFSEKAKKEMEEKQQQRAVQKKQPRNPEEEYLASMYAMSKKGQYGIPTSGIKNCAVSACRFVDGIPMTIARGAFHVLEDENGLTLIKSPGPVMDERTVRIGGFKKIAMMRYRGRFDKWEVSFPVTYNTSVLGAEQILHLFEVAGFSVGLCEHRPEKNGSNGRFQVKRS